MFVQSLSTFAIVVILTSPTFGQKPSASWADTVPFPKSEKPVRLFNGTNLLGWEGRKYWSITNDAIRGANSGSIPNSKYLFTQKSYRNFRLIFEVKQSRRPELSTMHSAVAVLGEQFEDQGDPFGFKGPLLMFCNDWGIWDAHRRNRVYPAGHKGTLQHPAEKIGEWNQIEVLVVGDRIRMVANGKLVIDFSDQPNILKPSPIGLQLHSNTKPQEYQFRGLILAENPEDRLVTLAEEKSK